MCPPPFKNQKLLDYSYKKHVMAYRQGDVIIRHLVMPNHVECGSFQVLEWIAENMADATVNIIGQYRPEYTACKYEEINKMITSEGYSMACKYGRKLGLNIVE